MALNVMKSPSMHFWGKYISMKDYWSENMEMCKHDHFVNVLRFFQIKF